MLVMVMKNKDILRSQISEAKFRHLVRLFCVDLNATQIAQVVSNTVNRLYSKAYENVLLPWL